MTAGYSRCMTEYDMKAYAYPADPSKANWISLVPELYRWESECGKYSIWEDGPGVFSARTPYYIMSRANSARAAFRLCVNDGYSGDAINI